MFVAESNNGRIYHFKLNQNRPALLLQGPLMDKAAVSNDEPDNVVFAHCFDDITTLLNIEPDGYQYVIANEDKNGIIYRIVPSHRRTWQKFVKFLNARQLNKNYTFT